MKGAMINVAKHRTRTWTSRVALLALLVAGIFAGNAPARAEGTGPNYRDVPYVTVSLGAVNQENGIRLITSQPDGLTQEIPESAGRQSLPNLVNSSRWFYFDVHDTYIMGGQNKVRITVTYKDMGQGPVVLEYDSFDPNRPNAKIEAVVLKPHQAVVRTNSEAWKTAYIELEDARFGNFQPGGADFRIGSTDELMIRNVSVLRISHTEPQSPLHIFLNGQEIIFDENDVQPMVHPQTNRTLVPVRRIFNALGIPDEDIKWIQETRTVEARLGQTTMKLVLDSDIAFVNGMPEQLDQPAMAVSGRILVPLRWVTSRFGLDVGWNPADPMMIYLTTPAQPAPTDPTQPTP